MKKAFDWLHATSLGRQRESKVRAGSFERAIQEYNQALLLNASDILSYANRGLAFARLGDDKRAYGYF